MIIKMGQNNVKQFSNRKEPNACEMTSVVKSVTSFLNARNDRQVGTYSYMIFLQTPENVFTGRPKTKGHTFFSFFC